MSTAAWCLVHDLLREAPPNGRYTEKSKARQEWFLEKLREAHAELLELRAGTESILEQEGQGGEGVVDLLERLVDERDEHMANTSRLEELSEEHKALKEDHEKLVGERDELARACDELKKRAELAEHRLFKRAK